MDPRTDFRCIEKRQYQYRYPRKRSTSVSLLTKRLLICGAVILCCVLLYIPVYKKTTLVAASGPSKAAVAGWSTDTSRDTRLYILPDNVTTLHEPPDLCGPHHLFLLIVVCSATDNYEQRAAIRDTWGNYSKYTHRARVYNATRDKYSQYNFSYDLYTEAGGGLGKWAVFQMMMREIARMRAPGDDTAAGYEDNPIPDNVSAGDTEPDFKLVFLLGLPAASNGSDVQDRIEKEVEAHGDIIQEGFVDTYNNLTLKSIMMLKWITQHCNGSVRYIMKTDDDMYVNVPRLMGNLRSRGGVAGDHLLIGDLICGARPVLDTTDKWYSPGYMYSGLVYPRYLSGMGYVLSWPTAALLYAAALRTPYFHLEDIYITGMCAVRASPLVRPRDDPSFSYARARGGDVACAAHSFVTSHRVSAVTVEDIDLALAQPDIVDR